MPGRKRLFSDPYSKENILTTAFGNLNLQSKDNNMAQITEIERKLEALILTNEALQQKVTELEASQATLRNNNNPITVDPYEDIEPTYTSGDGIQLDAFKIIPEFNGDKKVYRSWRSQVTKLMQQISAYKTHPRYAAALSIIRAKITGAASDILINNNTVHNIDAIVDRLDLSYEDQRPLYVIEAEMTNIKQGGKSLQEFYDAINQALNMVLTKITMSYKEANERGSLTTETQAKAIRTFVTGLNSALIRTTLYSNMPKSLSAAFAIAQTIQYDNQYLQLEYKQNHNTDQNKNPRKNSGDAKPNFNPNFQYRSQQPNQSSQPNNTMQQQKPTPMEVDNSKQYVQRNNAQPNYAVKRDREPTFQYVKQNQPSFQHVHKQQRVNHMGEPDDIQSVYHYDDTLENNHNETENDDCQSNASKQESIFLGE